MSVHALWHVHEPVRTLANSLISFRVPRKRKEIKANPLQRASRQRRDRALDESTVGESDGGLFPLRGDLIHRKRSPFPVRGEGLGESLTACVPSEPGLKAE